LFNNYLLYPSFAPKYALNQNEIHHRKKMMVSRNQCVAARPIGFFKAALTIPTIIVIMPRKLATNAIWACIFESNPKSVN
jgi:hypothetical protein